MQERQAGEPGVPAVTEERERMKERRARRRRMVEVGRCILLNGGGCGLMCAVRARGEERIKVLSESVECNSLLECNSRVKSSLAEFSGERMKCPVIYQQASLPVRRSRHVVLQEPSFV